MLGIRQVRSAALSLLMFEHLADHEQAQALRESAGRSILSGMLARGLAEHVSVTDTEQVFVCAMLPVVINGVCIGLIYGDHETVGASLGGDTANYLNTLRNQAALAIKQHR